MEFIEKIVHFDWQRQAPKFIILGVLAAAAILGLFVSKQLAILAVAGVGGTVLFFWLTRRIEWGVLALIPISYLVKTELGTGTESALNASILWVILLIGVWFARMVVIDRRLRLAPGRVNLPAILFLVVIALAFIAGNVQWLPFANARASIFAQAGGASMLGLPVATMLLAANVLREERWLRWITWSFLGLGAVYLVAIWFPAWSVLTNLFNIKAVSALFFIWCTALSGGMLLFNKEMRGWQRWAMSGMLALTLAVGIFLMRTSASSWVPALVALAVLCVLKWWRVGVLLGMAGGVVALSRISDLYLRFFGIEQYSAVTRAATWPIMWELVQASPLLGLGPSNYYYYTPLYSLMGYYVQFNSHNNYWDLAAQVGLLGLGVFIWMVASLTWTGWKLRRQVTTGFQSGFVNAALAGLAGTLVSGLLADWFMPFVYNIGFEGFRGAVFAWMFLGGLVAVERFVAVGQKADL